MMRRSTSCSDGRPAAPMVLRTIILLMSLSAFSCQDRPYQDAEDEANWQVSEKNLHEDLPAYFKRGADFTFGPGKRKPEHYSFGLGKRDEHSSSSNGKRGPKDFSFGLGKRGPKDFSFGLGKRGPKDFSFGLGKRGPKDFSFGLGKRSPKDFSFGLGKRGPKDFSFGLGKRGPKDFSFGLGKRGPKDFSFGLGKRGPKDFSFGLGKRGPKDFSFGLGKRGPKDFSFGLGKRGPKDFSFGLGKRGPKDFSFGLGKRGPKDFSFGLGKKDFDTPATEDGRIIIDYDQNQADPDATLYDDDTNDSHLKVHYKLALVDKFESANDDENENYNGDVIGNNLLSSSQESGSFPISQTVRDSDIALFTLKPYHSFLSSFQNRVDEINKADMDERTKRKGNYYKELVKQASRQPKSGFIRRSYNFGLGKRSSEPKFDSPEIDYLIEQGKNNQKPKPFPRSFYFGLGKRSKLDILGFDIST